MFEDFWESEYRRRLAQRALALIQKDFQPATWNACWELVVSDRPAKEVARRNRKPMRPSPIAPWELRVRDLRVYYDIEEGRSIR